MSYEQLLSNAFNEDFNNSTEYYEAIVVNKDSILLDIAKTSQAHVAKRLGMHLSKLSILLHLLRLDTLRV